MDNKRPFGWAVIGTGAIANKVMKEITATGRHKVVSAYSRTYKRAEEFAERFNAKCAVSLEEAIRTEGVDGVYIATPHSAHYSEIMECIGNGVPVLSEKAFTINSRQTEEIMRYARDEDVYVSEAMWTRYNPITLKIKEIISSGELGKVKSFKASFCYSMSLANFPERVRKKEYGGGALLDVGVYPISYAHMLFGMPDTIESTMKFNSDGTDDSNEMVFTYNNGVKCYLSSAINHFSTCGGVIHCEKGSITIPLFYRPTVAFIRKGVMVKMIRCKAGYIHQFDAVAEDILAGRKESRLMPLQDSYEVMTIMDAIRNEHGYRFTDQAENTLID